MKHLLRAAAGLSATLIVGGCSLNVKVGPTATGPVTADSRNVSPFHGVKVTLAANSTIEVGKTQSITVSAQKSVLPLIKTEVNEGTLEVSAERPFSTDRGVTIHIQTPNLDAFELAGAGSARITGVSGQRFKLALSGVGNADLSGKVDNLAVTSSGVGSVKAFDLIARTATVETSGVGSANVTATESITASTAGVGDITYGGNPKHVTSSASGVGKIRAR